MASSDGIHNNALIVNTIDGLTSIDATSVLIDNVPIVPGSFVPYTGADLPINLGNQRIFTTYVPTNQFDLVTLGTLTTGYVPYTGSNTTLNTGSQKIQTSSTPTSGNDVPNKTYTDTQDNLRVPYTGATTNLDMGLFRIRTAFDPVASPDVLNLGYSAGNLVPYTGALSGINLNSQNIQSTYAPIASADLTNKNYTDTQDNLRIPYTGAVSGINLNSQNIQSTYVPIASADLTNKNYTDTQDNLRIPYTGAVSAINLNSQNIKSTYVPTVGADLINKTYGDATYVSSAAGYAILSAGTLASPQIFTGYNNIGGFVFTTTPQLGSASTYLGRNSVGEVILTTPIPQQQLNSSSVTYYLVGNTSSVNLEPFIPYINDGISVTVNSSGVATKLTVPGLTFSGAPSAGSSTTILALDGSNNVITTTAATVVLQTKPTTATTIYLAGNISNTNAIAFAPYLTAGCYLTTNGGGAVTALDIPGLTLESGRVKSNADLFLTTSAQANFLYLRNAVSGLKMETTGVSPNLSTLLSTELTDATLTLISGKTFYLSSFQSGIQYQARTVGHTFTMGAPQVTYATIDTNGVNASRVNVDTINTFTSGSTLGLNATSNTIQFRVNTLTYASVFTNGISSIRFNGSGTTACLINSNEATAGVISFQKSNTTHCSIQISGSQSQLAANGALSLYSGTVGDFINIGSTPGALLFYTNNSLTATIDSGGFKCDTHSSNNSTKMIQFGNTGWTNFANTSTLFGDTIKNSGNWSSGNYQVFTNDIIVNAGTGGLGVWGGTGQAGIVSLQPGVSWQTLYLIGGPVLAYNTSVLGSTLSSTGWVNSSDRRFKTNIRPVKTTRSLERVLAVKPCTYNMIYDETQCPVSDKLKNQPCLGFIAQEIAESNPHCIHEVVDKGEIRFGLQYNDYVVHLCGSVQELHKTIEQQQKTINQLIEHVSTLTNAFNELKKNSL
jgi:hypothetical protein